MKTIIENIFSTNKKMLLVPCIASIFMIVMINLLNDISLSLYVIIAFLLFTSLSVLIVLEPFWGLIFIVAYMPFSVLIHIPMVDSGGRLLAIITMGGWFLRYFMRGTSILFDVVRSNKVIIFFILSMFISSVFAFRPMSSYKECLIITSYILMSFFMQDFIDNKKKLKILITVTALSVGLASLIGIFQYMAVVGGSLGEFGRVGVQGGTQRLGGFHNPNQYGKILMSGIPFLLYISLNTKSVTWKSICILLFLTSFFSLGISVSRTYLIEFSVFIITYFLLGLKHKIISVNKFLILSIISILILTVISPLVIDKITARAEEDISEQKRYVIVLKAIDMLKEHPLLGIGLNNLQYVNTADNKYAWLDIGGHEIVSSVFVSIGMLGSMLLIIIFYKIYKYFHDAAENCSLHGDNHLFNLIIVLQAGYLAHLSSAIGNGLIFDRILWTYFALAIIVNRFALCKIRPNHMNCMGRNAH